MLRLLQENGEILDPQAKSLKSMTGRSTQNRNLVNHRKKLSKWRLEDNKNTMAHIFDIAFVTAKGFSFHLVAKLMLFHERQQICSLSTVFITATLFSSPTV